MRKGLCQPQLRISLGAACDRWAGRRDRSTNRPGEQAPRPPRKAADRQRQENGLRQAGVDGEHGTERRAPLTPRTPGSARGSQTSSATSPRSTPVRPRPGRARGPAADAPATPGSVRWAEPNRHPRDPRPSIRTRTTCPGGIGTVPHAVPQQRQPEIRRARRPAIASGRVIGRPRLRNARDAGACRALGPCDHVGETLVR